MPWCAHIPCGTFFVALNLTSVWNKMPSFCRLIYWISTTTLLRLCGCNTKSLMKLWGQQKLVKYGKKTMSYVKSVLVNEWDIFFFIFMKTYAIIFDWKLLISHLDNTQSVIYCRLLLYISKSLMIFFITFQVRLLQYSCIVSQRFGTNSF